MFNLQKGKKFLRRSFTFSIKRETSRFDVVVVHLTAKTQKEHDTRAELWLPIAFLTFSLPP